MIVYVVGIGLIGGSMAIDIRAAYDGVEVYGVDADPSHLQEAIDSGIVDAEGCYENMRTADVVIVSVPVNVMLSELPQILDAVGEDTVIYDVGSTKEPICEVVKDHPKRRNFMAAHPIAGTEYSGPSAAHAGLFRGKTNIICEVEKTAFKLQERALKIFADIGMRIRYMDPSAHDKHIAYMSHLSHISSFMLGKTVIDKEKNEHDIFDMAGSGFESTVRLAKSSPAMWTPIFEQNKENVIETLEEYIHNLEHFKSLMETNRFDEVHQVMENTNRIKEILKTS